MENLVTYVPILKRCTAASLARMRAREPHAQLQGPKTAPCFALENKQSELEMLHTFHVGLKLVRLTGERDCAVYKIEMMENEAVAV